MARDLRVVIDATSACDRGCTHCGRNSNMKKVSHVSQPIIEVLMLQLKKLKHNNIRLSFTGGEPLLNPLLPEIVQHCSMRLKKQLKEIGIVTSGFLQDTGDESLRLQQILEEYDPQRLHISLSFNLFLPHSSQRMRNTLRFLLESGKRIGFLSINLCSSRENFWKTYEHLFFEVFNYVEIITATPMREILVQTWNPLFGIEDFSNKIWSPRTFVRLSEKSYSLPCHMLLYVKQSKPIELVISPFSITKQGRAKKLADRPWRGRGCSFLFSFQKKRQEEIHMATDGSLFPDCGCLCAPPLKIGDITKDDLNEILNARRNLSTILLKKTLASRNIFSSHTICETCQNIMWREKYAL